MANTIEAPRLTTNLHAQVLAVPIRAGQMVLDIDYFGLALLVRGYFQPGEPYVGARPDFEIEAVYVKATDTAGVRVEDYLPPASMETIRDLCIARARA